MNESILERYVDLACAAFVGVADHDILELSVYLTGDGFGVLGKYPLPKISIYGIAKTFSPYVGSYENIEGKNCSYCYLLFKNDCTQVWIGLILSIFVCIGSIQLLVFLYRKWFGRSTDPNNFSKVSMFIFAMITNQSKKQINSFV